MRYAQISEQPEQMNKKTILITGGAGYIGSHVARQLGARDESIITLDDLSTGFRSAVLFGDLVTGNTGAFSEVHDSRCGKSLRVEEPRGSKSDRRMAWGGKSLADRVAKKVALSVDGMKRDGDAQIKGVEDGTG